MNWDEFERFTPITLSPEIPPISEEEYFAQVAADIKAWIGEDLAKKEGTAA